MSDHGRWTGEPDRCMCTRMIVDTLEETLSCPGGWRALRDGRWAHVLGPGRRQR